MTHYILTKDNKTVADVEASIDNIQSLVVIDEFSKLLLTIDKDYDKEVFIADFAALQEIRGLYFESTPFPPPETPDEMAARVMKALAEKHDLWYVTD